MQQCLGVIGMLPIRQQYRLVASAAVDGLCFAVTTICSVF